MLSELENNNVNKIYEIISEHFSNTRVYTWKWVDKFIYSLSFGSSILDLGCGNGRNMNYKKYNFVGIDNCNGFLKICREKNLNVINANMTNIPIKSELFDAVICIASFHHLSTICSRIKCLNEMKRLIKYNGIIMISVWSIEQPLKTKKNFIKYGDTFVTYNKFGKIYNRYYYIFELDEIKLLFKNVGLKIIKYFYDCGNEIFILKK